MSITETIDEIDRLITNSSAISMIKPLLTSLREQAEAIEARVRTLESKSKVKRLEGENDFLKTELDTALKQIQELENTQKGTHKSDRTGIEVKILLLLAKEGSWNSDEIADALKVGKQIVEFYLKELMALNFIYCAGIMGTVPIRWFLDQEGRRYLMTRSLLK